MSHHATAHDVEALDVGEAQAIPLGAVPHVHEPDHSLAPGDVVERLYRHVVDDVHPAAQVDDEQRPRIDVHVAGEHARSGGDILARLNRDSHHVDRIAVRHGLAKRVDTGVLIVVGPVPSERMDGRDGLRLEEEPSYLPHDGVERFLDLRNAGGIREPQAEAIALQHRDDPPGAIDAGHRELHPHLLGAIACDALLDDAVARPLDRRRLLLHGDDLAPSRRAARDDGDLGLEFHPCSIRPRLVVTSRGSRDEHADVWRREDRGILRHHLRREEERDERGEHEDWLGAGYWGA